MRTCEALQHGIAAHRHYRLEGARLGTELLLVHAGSRSLAPSPYDASEDNQTHRTGVVEQNRPTDLDSSMNAPTFKGRSIWKAMPPLAMSMVSPIPDSITTSSSRSL